MQLHEKQFRHLLKGLQRKNIDHNYYMSHVLRFFTPDNVEQLCLINHFFKNPSVYSLLQKHFASHMKFSMSHRHTHTHTHIHTHAHLLMYVSQHLEREDIIAPPATYYLHAVKQLCVPPRLPISDPCLGGLAKDLHIRGDKAG